MVAAGTGANVAITLFIIGEGRWEAQNFPNGEVDPTKLTWDFVTQSSDYSTARQTLLATNGGRTWNNAFANQGSILSQDVVNGQPTSIGVGSTQVGTFAQAYAQQGVVDGETTEGDIFHCTSNFDLYAASTDQVVACSSGTGAADGGTGAGDAGSGDAGSGDAGSGDAGAGGSGADLWSSGPPCSGLAANQIPASVFACGGLDDIATALVGMHPQSVWLTRLEANLPRAALSTDLVLQASSQQVPISNVFNLTRTIGDPCAFYPPSDAGAGSMRVMRDVWTREQLAVYGTIFAVVAAAVARRRRPAPARARAR
jgi:hypothetical protein